MAYSNYSVLFDGSTNYVDLGNVHNLSESSPWSWSWWAKPSSLAGTYIICKMGPASAYTGWGWYQNTDGTLLVQIISNYGTGDYIRVTTVPQVLFAGYWSHLAVTYTGSGAANGFKIYRNGQEVSLTVNQDSLTGSISNSYNLNFGRRDPDGWGEWPGVMDDVSVYNVALGLSDVEDLYNGGVPNAISGLSCWSSNRGWWKMGDGDTYPTLLDSGNGTVNNGTMSGGMTSGNIVADTPGLGVPGSDFSFSPFFADGTSGNIVDGTVFSFIGGGGGVVNKYKMRAIDSDQISPPRYITWVATGEPDFDGSVGYSTGTPTPVGPIYGSAVVVAEWQE